MPVTEARRMGRDRWTGAVLTRLFATSREKLFDAWTLEYQVAAWWGPRGFTSPVCNWEAGKMGDIYIDMTSRDGLVFPLTGRFHECIRPERLAFTTRAFRDTLGHPQLRILNTVIFTSEGRSTRLTLEATVLYATPQAAAAMKALREGWRQSLDKLAEYLEHQKNIEMNHRLIIARSLNTDIAALLLRILFGGLFAYYGYQKLVNYHQILAIFGDPIGLGTTLSLQLVIFAEFLCGIFVLLGFFTRLSVIPIFITMIVAYFVSHAKDPFQAKQVAFIFLWLSPVIFILGSGRISIDGLWQGRGRR